ncbi:MAG: transcriptional regulator protein-like protein [Limisphaerales bacterium]|nr:MAG: transcriptional regulator protein-like protein [Limisphaerales bacterium]KAG0510106.1 MAG: transcriptional regulator protein-like protein [Limisphaerales bacterium]TXT52949.1 MAG: transcriptional regulator protein-like protein [Limisphaerales bacterium]
MALAASETVVHPPASAPPLTGLTPLEAEAVDLFVGLAQVVGLPKSIGQIYGLLYISATPLSLDDIADRLDISKGSASQGLKFLRTTGAVRLCDEHGSRCDHYEAETGLRALATGFLKEQIEPHLESGEDRLARLKRLAANAPAAERTHVVQRVKQLESWHRRAAGLLPLLIRFLGK